MKTEISGAFRYVFKVRHYCEMQFDESRCTSVGEGFSDSLENLCRLKICVSAVQFRPRPQRGKVFLIWETLFFWHKIWNGFTLILRIPNVDSILKPRQKILYLPPIEKTIHVALEIFEAFYFLHSFYELWSKKQFNPKSQIKFFQRCRLVSQNKQFEFFTNDSLGYKYRYGL